MSAKLKLEITPDNIIKVVHGTDGTVLLTGRAASVDAWNNICRAIYENTADAKGPFASAHESANNRITASRVTKGSN